MADFRPYMPSKLGWAPFFLGLTLSFGVVIIFIIAVVRKDVPPLLPYISEAGGKQPESGIFAIILFLGAVLGFITMYSRYRIVAIKTGHQPRNLKIINQFAFLCGMISLFGMVMVAAYPIFILAIPHSIGAFLFFLFSVVYVLLQAILSYKMCPECNGIEVAIVRFFVCILAICCLLVFLITNRMMFGKISNDETKVARAKLAGAIAEWLMALCLVVFFFSFIGEFRSAKLNLHVHVVMENFENTEEENRPVLHIESIQRQA